MKLPRTAAAMASVALVITLAGCSSEPEAAAPNPVDQDLPDASAPVSAEDVAGGDGADASESDSMVSGSNDEDTRKPDPKRSKLIKADPS